MLRRRDSTSASPSGGSPSLNLVINQRPFLASTAETEETESPQSETPALPPRPTPPSRPLPSIYVSPLEEHPHFPSRPPDTVPRSTPQSPQFPQVPQILRFPQIPVYPSPIQPIQPSPGGFVGRLPVGSPSQHGPSREHHKTADYTYRSGTPPSFRPDSGPSRYESTNVTRDIHAKIWPTYNRLSQECDEKILARWDCDFNTLLILVSLIVRGDHQFPSD